MAAWKKSSSLSEVMKSSRDRSIVRRRGFCFETTAPAEDDAAFAILDPGFLPLDFLEISPSYTARRERRNVSVRTASIHHVFRNGERRAGEVKLPSFTLRKLRMYKVEVWSSLRSL